jgi:hypothetical protein
MHDSPAHSPSPHSHPLPEFAGYSVLRALTPARSYLALAPGGRHVVLKMLDADCLLRRQLHPNIRDRLARVRELAHPGIANLHGVERDAGRVFMVWDFVQGQTLDQRAMEWESPAEAALAARELLLTIESLHALGIVHGALHAGNIILDARHRVRLTHVSPLLYDDPADDVRATVQTLAEIVRRRQWENSPLGRAVLGKDAPAASLARLRARIALDAEGDLKPTLTDTDCGVRRWTAAGAIGVALLGALVGLGLLWIAWGTLPHPPVPPQIPASQAQ